MEIQEIQVPENFKYVLDRGAFEYRRASSNLAFMLEKHASDPDGSFMDSSLYGWLKQRAIDTRVQQDLLLYGVLVNLFGEAEVPDSYWSDNGNHVIRYYPKGVTGDPVRAEGCGGEGCASGKNGLKKHRRFMQFQDWFARMFPELVALHGKEGADGDDHAALVRSVTFQVTDACSLACSYCYQINKGANVMDFETAKTAVDKMLRNEAGFSDYLRGAEGIILDFIGGEPLLQVDLIDRIVDYFREQAILLGHPWSERFCISLCSNGVAYRDPKVQAFLKKNADHLSFSVTVDGTKELHDACRVFPDTGKGSYDLAHDAAMDWKAKGFYMGSKITMAPANIQYFADCLKQMVLDGYYDINANEVFEKGWKPEHGAVVYGQVKEFADWMRENGYRQEDYAISFLGESWCTPMEETDNRNWCGGLGEMLSFDPSGRAFPCIRYMESSLGTDQEPVVVGSVDGGLLRKEEEKAAFGKMQAVTRRSQSTDECFYCPIASGCSWCSAYNYQVNGTVDKRATFICDIQKARALCINYYWNTYYREKGIDEACDLWIPREWAAPMVGDDEYTRLAELTKSLGGSVNEHGTMVRGYRRAGKEES